MTDARFPERWLSDRRVLQLPAEDFRAWWLTTVWCVSNRTNGIVTRSDLRFMPWAPDPDRMIAGGVWAVVDDGWLVVSFLPIQSSRKQMEASDRALAKEAEAARLRRLAKREATATTEIGLGKAAGQLGVGTDVGAYVGTDAPRTETATAPATGEVLRSTPKIRAVDPPIPMFTCEDCGRATSFQLGVRADGVRVCRTCKTKTVMVNGRA